MQSFKNQFYCEPTISAKEHALIDAALAYVTETEAFDRTVCSGPIINGSIQPATPSERAKILKNARCQFDAVVSRGKGQFTEKELRRAIARAEARL